MSKKYFVTDVHGNYKGLIEALERSPYDRFNDTLILGGDLVDGGYESALIIDLLASMKYQDHNDIILINGNHDMWFKHWLEFGINPVNWLQGQKQTAESYIKFVKDLDGTERQIIPDGKGAWKCNLTYIDIPQSHRDFLNTGVNYYIDQDTNNLFVHGGFNRHLKINEQQFDDIYYWDRDLWSQALSYQQIKKIRTEQCKTDPDFLGGVENYKFKMKDTFNNIFIGHTSTVNWNKTTPMKAVNIINCDTGAGFNGKVTIIDTETLEYWQSDLVKDLYGEDFKR